MGIDLNFAFIITKMSAGKGPFSIYSRKSMRCDEADA
jgi:hypothetical protein